MTNARGVGQRVRSRGRLGTSGTSPVAGRHDPRWDRNARQRSTDFVKGQGLRVNRDGRDEVAIANRAGNILRVDERGELFAVVDKLPKSAQPAPVRVGDVQDPDTAAAINTLVAAVNRLQEIVREQELTG